LNHAESRISLSANLMNFFGLKSTRERERNLRAIVDVVMVPSFISMRGQS